MPWSPAQMKVIQARAHGWKKGKAFAGVSEEKARMMAKEGVKRGKKKPMHRMSGSRMMEGGSHAQADDLERGGRK